jgi:hypothetical protein
MRTPFTILVLLFSSGLWAQSSQSDSVDYYISMLNPNSVIVGTTYVPTIALDSNAQRLISLKNKEVSRRLYAHLSEKGKTIAIHAILTRQFNINSSISQKYTYKADSISAVDFTYNGLGWHYDLKSGKSTISDDAVSHAQTYWRKRIKE